MKISIRYAVKEDTNKLRDLLQNANLSLEGLEETIDYFLIMEDSNRKMIATLGIEPLQSVGLLRSFVVSGSLSEQHIIMMFDHMLQLAREKALTSLYLASNKQNALTFFEEIGFRAVSKQEIPKDLYHSSHLKNILNVDNSTIMELNL
ncbi:GNAT family N-acetyltransferase [Mesobacillus harenae]|uniref:GNAT family N-acetyltransferase n=1 Tax=Mesobacillus harenae TaxID=2213203 RepID=UPI00158078D0|nr:hypothetical protein [Mesobacillus harenae]